MQGNLSSTLGDLAARNVLVDSQAGLILADFDLATWEGSVAQKCAEIVPIRWVAPEVREIVSACRCIDPTVLHHLQCLNSKPTLYSDAWAFGT